MAQKILRGTLLKQEIVDCIRKLYIQNENLVNLKKVYDNLSNEDEFQGQTAEAIKFVARYYVEIIVNNVRANDQDINDLKAAERIVTNEYFNIDEIDNAIQKNNSDIEEAEIKRDEAKAALEVETSPTLVDFYYQEYENYKELIEIKKTENECWEKKKERFDEIIRSTATLFVYTNSVRRELLIGYNSIRVSFKNNVYNVTIKLGDWKKKVDDLVEHMPEYSDTDGIPSEERYKRIDGSGVNSDFDYSEQWCTINADGTKEYDIRLVYWDMTRAGSMSDDEFAAYIQILKNIGVDIPGGFTDDELRENLKDIVMQAILDEYNREAALGRTPYNRMTQEQRELFVYLYEEKYDDQADKMNALCNQLGEGDNWYPGWEVDAINIKFLAYTADEPYKTAFISNANQIKINTTRADSVQCVGGLDLNFANTTNHDIETYSLMFHEGSHAIFNIKKLNDQYSEEVLKRMKADLIGRIETEVDSWVVANFPNLGEDDKKLLKLLMVDCFMNQVDFDKYSKPRTQTVYGEHGKYDEIVYEKTLDFQYIMDNYSSKINGMGWKDVERCFQEVRTDLKNVIQGPIGDQYGGLTGNTIGGGHKNYRNNNGKEYLYWDKEYTDSNGVYIKIGGEPFYISDDNHFDEDVILADGNRDYDAFYYATEMFAEGMDSHITKRSSEVKNMKLYSDETLECFDDMVKSAC